MSIRNCAAGAAACAILVAIAATAKAAPTVVLPNGKQIVGKSIKADEEGKIYLTTDKAILPFPAGTTVVVDEPPEYRRAIQLIQQQQYDTAIRTLNGIVENYRFLNWDKRARVLLASALYGKGAFDEAAAMYETVARENPTALNDEETSTRYLTALLRSQQFDKLEPLLDETIQTGPREAAARAQVMRANLRMEQGDVENAVLDFLRTVEFFREAADVRPEAAYKAAECLSRLEDERAGRYYTLVVNEYPDSAYAEKARAKVQ